MSGIDIKEQSISIFEEGTKKILFQMEKCICKIYLNNNNIATGYFCKISFNNILFPVLIINNIMLEDIDNNKIIKLTVGNEEKKIKIDKSRKKYINPDLNIAIIEIKPNKDKIYNYLDLNEKNIYKNIENLDYRNKLVYIIDYQNEKARVTYNLISHIIDNKTINYGSPILSLNTFEVIGIHYCNSKNNNINYELFMNNIIDKFNNNKYKNEINIIYKTDKEGEENIFGDKFVENNKNNIELIINGNKNELISKYKLKKGENNIKIIIKNKITNLEYMFYECKSLKNIKELEYLDTKDINNFSFMFYKCSSLSDIKGLQNWNVSNGNNFSHLFFGCSSLSDIKALENWNVSNGNITKMECLKWK